MSPPAPPAAPPATPEVVASYRRPVEAVALKAARSARDLADRTEALVHTLTTGMSVLQTDAQTFTPTLDRTELRPAVHAAIQALARLDACLADQLDTPPDSYLPDQPDSRPDT